MQCLPCGLYENRIATAGPEPAVCRLPIQGTPHFFIHAGSTAGLTT
jgi:hypothetical protein